MASQLIIIILFTILLPIKVFSNVSYDMSYVDGRAKFNIDGDISDWTPIGLEKVQLRDYESILPRNNENLSANFQCIADNKYLYICVDVIDDKLVFGEEMLGNLHWDDTVRISFPFMQSSNSKKVRISISCDEHGKALAEYTELGNLAIPHIWESLGVKYALKINESGYVVEVAIPKKLICNNETEMLVNVVVVDDDDGEDYEGWYQSTYDYGVFMPYIKLKKGDKYTQQEINKIFPQNIDETYKNKIKIENHKTKRDNLLVTNANSDAVISILQDYWNQRWEQAEIKIIKSNKTEPWMNPMLAWIYYMDNKHDKAIQMFSQISKESEEKYVKLWAEYQIGYIYMTFVKDYISAKKIYKNIIKDSYWFSTGFAALGLEMCNVNNTSYEIPSNIVDITVTKFQINPIVLYDIATLYNPQNKLHYYEKALSLLNNKKPWLKQLLLKSISREYINQREKSKALMALREIIDMFPDYNPILYSITEELENAGGYEEAVNIYEKMMYSEYKETRLKAQLGMASVYYHIGFYKHSKEIAETLIGNDNMDVKYKAQMIIYSIENRLYKGK